MAALGPTVAPRFAARGVFLHHVQRLIRGADGGCQQPGSELDLVLEGLPGFAGRLACGCGALLMSCDGRAFLPALALPLN